MGAHMRMSEGTMEAWIDVHPNITSHGLVRGAVLVMLVDVGAGWAAERRAETDWTFTVDIGIRREPVVTERFDGEPVVQRAGRTISIEVAIVDDRGRRSASGVATFIRLPRRADDPPRTDFPTHVVSDWPRATRPLDELLAASPTPHGMSVDLRADLLNPAGILQGGVAALLAEIAAQQALESATGERLVVTAFDVRYVTMGRVGPIEAVVNQIGNRAAEVRLLDRGANDAVVTHNLLTFDAAP